MIIARTLPDLEQALKNARVSGRTVALVPTMGALHDGHLSLIKLARQIAGFTVVSIFVNPRQFESTNDLENYPRTEDADIALLERSETDLLFMPEVKDVYPEDVAELSAGALGEIYEGKSRKGHFSGVLTVVSRLFDLVEPDFAVFGEKDAQQLHLIQKMTDFQNVENKRVRDIQIVSAPTVRDSSGLALSSRNLRLTPADRNEARVIYRSLKIAAQAITAGSSPDVALTLAREAMSDRITIDYLALVSASDFAPISDNFSGDALLLFAGYLSGVRLIDNIRLSIRPESQSNRAD